MEQVVDKFTGHGAVVNVWWCEAFCCEQGVKGGVVAVGHAEATRAAGPVVGAAFSGAHGVNRDLVGEAECVLRVAKLDGGL